MRLAPFAGLLMLIAISSCESDAEPTVEAPPIADSPSALCHTVVECAQQAAESAQKSALAYQVAVPAGAVMAFNLPECPPGWKTFEAARGRFVLGAGKGERDQHDKHLSERVWKQVGGEEVHTLTPQEMPKHSHKVHGTDHCHTPRNSDCAGREYGTYIDERATTTEAGGGAAHNNMPPYIVLTYCERAA